MPQFIATCAKSLEYLLLDELAQFDVSKIKEGLSQVSFEASWESAYQFLMWSRVASRLFYPVASFKAEDEQALYKNASIVDWSQHIRPGGSFIINAQSFRSKLSHTQFVSQRIKDSVMDYFREQEETLPIVEYEEPEVVIHCRIKRNDVTLSIDLAGAGLHRRNYRLQGGGAPIKENLAAALLIRAGWPSENQVLYDPMCGSGTFLIEAALMALDIAPGLFRDYLGLFGWNQFDKNLWSNVVEAAENRREEGLKNSHLNIKGSDKNPRAIRNAQANIALAGLEDIIETQIAGIDQLAQFDFEEKGLVIVNPPYSERLGERVEVKALYDTLGNWFKSSLKGWRASVLCPEKEFGHALGIRAKKIYKFNNGSIPCELLNLEIEESNFVQRTADHLFDSAFKEKLSEQGLQLLNRIEKNRSKLKRYLSKENITCYRIYDADIPEFNAAIDVYENKIHIQEYKPPRSVDEKLANRRLKEIQRVAAGIFKLPVNQVILKQRQQQKGNWQYHANKENEDSSNHFFKVSESGRQFWVNLEDYLDTGLFLDHRATRNLFAESSAQKSVLNLFCYTSSVSVYAATAGAKSTTNVDMSNTYLSWAKRNFKLNNIDLSDHVFERADCLKWLDEAVEDGLSFDLIFLDPPTFSNSKKMEGHFDVQSDHPKLIENCLKLLSPKGELFFSNNFKKFEMNVQNNDAISIREITSKTTSPDFARNPLHRCWVIKRR